MQRYDRYVLVYAHVREASINFWTSFILSQPWASTYPTSVPTLSTLH